MNVVMVTITDGDKADDVSVSLYTDQQSAWESLFEFYESLHGDELPGTYTTWDQFWALTEDQRYDFWNENVGLGMEMDLVPVFGSSRT